MGVTVQERPKGSGLFYVVIHHNGKRKSKKIGGDKKAARAIARKLETNLALGELNLDEDKKIHRLLNMQSLG